jgi:hypothetical protein
VKSCKFRVIGTNSTTKHLENKVFEIGDFVFTQRHQVLEAFYNGDVYLFDLKSVTFCDKGVLVSGFISDENKNVGRISFKYL